MRSASLAAPLAVSAAVIVIASSLAAAPAPRAGAPVTQPFRDEHATLRRHLDHLRERAGALRADDPAARKASMDFVVAFLQDHIRPHAEWEEQVLYPAVDRLAGGGGREPFTATMRYEHGVVGRWIDELAGAAKGGSQDADAFARRTDNLLGLLDAHFEEEEQVLLPLIDRGMSPARFQREIGSRMPARDEE